MKIIETSLKRPVTVLIGTIALIIFGIYSLSSMGVERMPNVEFPIVVVQTVMEGASPSVVDNDVTDVLEEQINTISGIKNITSNSYEGQSVIVVEFELDRDIDAAAADVRAKVNVARASLPDEVNEPVVDKFNFSDMAIMTISVHGDADGRTISRYVDKVVKERLQTVRGVGSAQPVGFRKREIRVWLDPSNMEARGLTAGDVQKAFGIRHVEMPAGRIETRTHEYGIRLEGEYRSVDELRNLAITSSNGAVTRLRDVARVEDGFEDLRSMATYNGKPTILVQIRKQRGANEVELARRVREKVAQLNSSAPSGVELDIVYDSTEFVLNSMSGVKKDILMGILLTSVIMFLFLRTLRATLVAVITIPVCLLGSLIVLNAMNITINNMTMLGLSLAVGMVIDSTTVVMENVHRHREMGKSRFRAALDGGSEVAFSVLAGAGTTMAVFLPVAFMDGIIGRFFYCFGITVAMTILISLIISLTLTPFLCSRILGRNRRGRLETVMERPLLLLEGGYRRFLGVAVRHRFMTLAVAAALFVSGLFMASRLGSEFFPVEDRGYFKINFELPADSSLHETERFLHELESILETDSRISYTYGTVGSDAGGEVYKGTLNVVLRPRTERPPFYVIMGEYRRKLVGYRDVEILMGRWGGSDISLVLQGPSTERLAEIGSLMKKELLERKAGLVDVNTDLRMNKPRVNIGINRGVADDLGIDVKDLSREVRTWFGGTKAGVFKDGGYRYDIRLCAESSNRDDPSKLGDVLVRTAGGDLIRAEGIMDVEVSTAPNVINRYNRQRSLEIGANVDGIAPGDGIKIMEEVFEKYAPEDGSITMSPAGDSEHMKESFASLVTALGFAILLVYMVMAVQFESFLHPLTVMFSLPLMTAGAFGFLLLAHIRMSVMSFMGIILLVGIVVNNAILLVDFINQQRAGGLDKVSAVLAAGPMRLRPILMTAASTMIGVLPIALGLSEGGEVRQPMSVAVIGGLLTSTLLTLVAIPVIYLVMDDVSDWMRARVNWFRVRRRGMHIAGAIRKRGIMEGSRES